MHAHIPSRLAAACQPHALEQRVLDQVQAACARQRPLPAGRDEQPVGSSTRHDSIAQAVYAASTNHLAAVPVSASWAARGLIEVSTAPCMHVYGYTARCS